MSTEPRHYLYRQAVFFGVLGEPIAIQLGRFSVRARDFLIDCLGEGKIWQPGGEIVTLSVAEAIAVARYARRTAIDREVARSFTRVLEGGFFNCFWENGLEGAARKEEACQ